MIIFIRATARWLALQPPFRWGNDASWRSALITFGFPQLRNTGFPAGGINALIEPVENASSAGPAQAALRNPIGRRTRLHVRGGTDTLAFVRE